MAIGFWSNGERMAGLLFSIKVERKRRAGNAQRLSHR
jgi:hypothetical protein